MLTLLISVIGGCAGDREGSPTGTTVEVVPRASIVPSGDAPDPVTDVCEECERKLRARQYAATVAWSDGVLAGTPPDVKAVAQLCGGVARVNLGRYPEGLRYLNRAESAREHFPRSVEDPMLELLYRAKMVGYASLGDAKAVSRTWVALQKVSPASAERVRREVCTAAVDPRSIPMCVGASPSSAPGTPTDGPSPEGTGDPATRSPDTDVTETDGPRTDAPGTDAPETDVPDTDVPDTDVPDTDAPERERPDVSPPQS